MSPSNKQAPFHSNIGDSLGFVAEDGGVLRE